MAEGESGSVGIKRATLRVAPNAMPLRRMVYCLCGRHQHNVVRLLQFEVFQHPPDLGVFRVIEKHDALERVLCIASLGVNLRLLLQIPCEVTITRELQFHDDLFRAPFDATKSAGPRPLFASRFTSNSVAYQTGYVVRRR